MGKNPAFTGITFEAAAETILSTLSPEQRQDAARKAWHFVNSEARLKAISHHAKLLAVVRMLIGHREPELFRDMALVKPPRLGREKPWHRDHAYFDYPLETPVVGVWIALDTAPSRTAACNCCRSSSRETDRAFSTPRLADL